MTHPCPFCATPLPADANVCPGCGRTRSLRLERSEVPPQTASGFAVPRKDERFSVPTDVRLRKIGLDGELQKEERTVAHDLSRSGMRLLTSWSDLEEGDQVVVEEVGGNFNSAAIVKHVTRGPDHVTRVGVEFLHQAPDRMVGTTAGLPRPRFSSVQSSVTPPKPAAPPAAASSFSPPVFTRTQAVSRPPRVEIQPPASPPPPATPPRAMESVLEEIGTSRAAVHELVAEGKVWEALDLLTKLQPLADGTPEEWAVRILTFETQARVPSLLRAAQQNLEDLARSDPANAAVQIVLGRIYRSAGLSARARAAFKQVLATDPDNREAAAALKLLGDATKAR